MKLQQALDFVKKGDLSGAKHALQKYLENNPKDPIGNYHLGMCYSHLGDLDLSEELLLKAVSLDESFVSARVGLGVLYAKKKDKPKAEIQFTKVLEIDETNINAKKNLASLYTGTGNYKKALDLYLSIPAEDRKDIVSLYAVSFCYLKSEQLSHARDVFQELEKLPVPESMKKEISELKELIEEKNIESEGIWTLLKKPETDS
ncbi:tetratricopeptide repeat protein [Leptospira santarosai]|uniref:Tetratricopeptide repeat protein n=4 Tax=Leptospira santarosai TaxID=28183 RepID=A0A2P1QW83_9LEPT|nr:tetratricopeptide repeat protein [Leptospira santarosai]EMO56211.1 tetratricopeptide repeat protein [Leptospira santarosai str. CBC1416]AVQ12987.1 Tetratricopeptide repeat protein [Leptospira santarosai]AVV79064.1 Tetratricopeptide repeat protein [Leptospira santarosai]EMM77131.1 tetratricopeptide repeat protein [Leptospira santarosai str. 2000030832]EMN21405.1 tetratricopeptide repeat protein [Leptospira santarosai serovar Arenal str. MAVJ 401]